MVILKKLLINNKNVLKRVYELNKSNSSIKNGGYTRTIRCGLRNGDSAEMTKLELSI